MEIFVRDPKITPDEIKVALEILSLGEAPQIVGSAKYVNHKYPSDVDVFEKFHVLLHREGSVKFVAERIRNIMRNYVINSDRMFLTDFKIGEDNEGPLRWTANGILMGETVRGHTLEEAVASGGVIKLDVAVWANVRYQSVELYYMVSDLDGEYRVLPAYLKSIAEDIDKYTVNYNPLKVLKRLWILARVKKCWNFLEILDPILSSDASALNQVVNDIEVLQMFLTQLRQGRVFSKQQIRQWFLEVQNLEKRITNHSQLDYPQFFQKVYLSFLQWYRTGNFDTSLGDDLEKIEQDLQPIIYKQADAFFKELSRQNIDCSY